MPTVDGALWAYAHAPACIADDYAAEKQVIKQDAGKEYAYNEY